MKKIEKIKLEINKLKNTQAKSFNLHSTHLISKYIKANIDTTGCNFIPFVKERNSVGRLLANNSERALKSSQPNSQRTLKKNPFQKKLNNIAFLSSKVKTSPRVNRKSNESVPVGLYNPTSIYDVSSLKHLPIYKSGRFTENKRHGRCNSIDYIDLTELHKRTYHKASVICLDKMLPREILRKPNESAEKLMIPRLELPDYLKRFKGLYHVGELGKTHIFPIQKDTVELTIDLKEKINRHMAGLRNINSYSKELVKNIH